MTARLAFALLMAAFPGVAAAQAHHHDMAPPAAAAPMAGSVPAAPMPDAPAHPEPGEARPGDAAAPAAPADHAADRFYPADRMAAARRILAREHGGMSYHLLIANIAEAQVRDGRDGYRWDAEGWYGSDIERLVVKTEGTADRGRSPEADAQLLYSRAIDPYWNLQAGVRRDLGRGANRTWATAGIEGLAPYWFEVEGALFLSNRGEVQARIEAYYDQRITQALILQPRIEFNLAAQRSAALRQGGGLNSVDLDLRLRYEITREFAPYVGISHRSLSGATARYARSDGERPHSTALVLGARAWF